MKDLFTLLFFIGVPGSLLIGITWVTTLIVVKRWPSKYQFWTCAAASYVVCLFSILFVAKILDSTTCSFGCWVTWTNMVQLLFQILFPIPIIVIGVMTAVTLRFKK